MFVFIRRNLGQLTFWLSLLAICIGGADLWRYGFVSGNWLKTHNDAISALGTIANSLLLLVAGVFSYYRFFRGRTLASRANVKIQVSVHNTPEDFLIHAMIVEVVNVGNSTIWSPLPKVLVRIHGPIQIQKTEIIEGWVKPFVASDGIDKFAVIEPGETVSFYAQRNIPKKAWAVTYIASVTADNNDTWTSGITVSNEQKSDKANS